MKFALLKQLRNFNATNFKTIKKYILLLWNIWTFEWKKFHELWNIGFYWNIYAIEWNKLHYYQNNDKVKKLCVCMYLNRKWYYFPPHCLLNIAGSVLFLFISWLYVLPCKFFNFLLFQDAEIFIIHFHYLYHHILFNFSENITNIFSIFLFVFLFLFLLFCSPS